MTRMRFIFVLPALLLLTACAGSFQADVSRFHRLERPSSQTVKIVPQDDAKIGSLEFQTYANMIAPELNRLGYTVVAPSDTADLIARVDYEVADGNTVVRSYPNQMYLHGGYYYRPWYGNWSNHGAYSNDVRSYIVYPRRLDLQIVHGDMTPEDPDWMVYEGHAQSQGRNDRLHEIMPLLIQALFTNFPGESGDSNVVVIELD